MPSMTVIGDVAASSGGQTLVSGNTFSGQFNPVGGIQLKLADAAPGVVYIGLPPPSFLSGVASGATVTLASGGNLTSGGMNDGFEVGPGDSYFVPKVRLTSGILSVRVISPAGSSGGRLFWESMAWFLTTLGSLAAAGAAAGGMLFV